MTEPPRKRQRVDYFCTLCEVNFTEKKSLLRHCRENKSHLEKLQIPGIGRIGCALCSATFARIHDLDRHLLRVHNSQQSTMDQQGEKPKTLESETSGVNSTSERVDIFSAAYIHEPVPAIVQVPENVPPKYDQLESTNANPIGEYIEAHHDRGSDHAEVDWLSPHGSPISLSNSVVSYSAIEVTTKGSSESRTSNDEKFGVHNGYEEPAPIQRTPWRGNDQHSVTTISEAPDLCPPTANEPDSIDNWISSAFEHLYMNDSYESKVKVGATHNGHSLTVQACTICRKSYSKPADLIQCMLKHLDQPLRPSKCTDCEFGFVRKDHLEEHLRQASTQQHCGFRFPHDCTGHHPPDDHSSENGVSLHCQMEMWYFAQLCMKSQKSSLKLFRADGMPEQGRRWSLDILHRRPSNISLTSSLNSHWTTPTIMEWPYLTQEAPPSTLHRSQVLLETLRNPGQNRKRLQQDLQLHYGITNGRPDVIRSLAKEGIDFSIVVPGYPPLIRTMFFPLILALEKGSEEVVQTLLECGATAELCSLREHLPCEATLTAAVRVKSLMALRLLLAAGVNINTPDNDGITALYAASIEQNPVFLEFLVSRGADINQKGGPCGSPLCFAVEAKDVKLIQLLLGLRADIKFTSNDHGAALCHTTDSDVTELFITLGAHINREGAYRGSPLCYALEAKDMRLFKLLIGLGADPNFTSDTYGPPLCHTPHTEAAELLIASGADINRGCAFHQTPMSWAIKTNNFDRVKLLLSNGANVPDDAESTSAVVRALGRREKNNEVFELLRMLIKINPRIIDLPYGGYSTLLCFASGTGQLEMVESLLDLGARVYIFGPTDPNGSAIHCACSRGHLAVVRLLLQRSANPDLICQSLGTALIYLFSRLMAARTSLCPSGVVIAIAQSLLDHGADPNLAVNHCTPLQAILCTSKRIIREGRYSVDADLYQYVKDLGKAMELSIRYGANFDFNCVSLVCKTRRSFAKEDIVALTHFDAILCQAIFIHHQNGALDSQCQAAPRRWEVDFLKEFLYEASEISLSDLERVFCLAVEHEDQDFAEFLFNNIHQFREVSTIETKKTAGEDETGSELYEDWLFFQARRH